MRRSKKAYLRHRSNIGVRLHQFERQGILQWYILPRGQWKQIVCQKELAPHPKQTNKYQESARDLRCECAFDATIWHRFGNPQSRSKDERKRRIYLLTHAYLNEDNFPNIFIQSSNPNFSGYPSTFKHNHSRLWPRCGDLGVCPSNKAAIDWSRDEWYLWLV